MSKFDFTGIDFNTVDPDKLDLGTKLQDCSLIANTFERGAHATPTEAAVFAPLTRILQNNKNLSNMISQTLKPYLQVPNADKTSEQAKQHASKYMQQNQEPTDTSLQGINFKNVQIATHDKSFGDKLLKLAKDCIPCDLRIVAFMELNPQIDLLDIFEDFIQKQIETMMNAIKLLTNIDMYGDFCNFLNLMSFMCIPDLQRIIALLMALFMLEVPTLDGMIGLISGLIVPIFAPILLGLTNLLNQFSLMVTNPLECVHDAIDQQVKKLNLQVKTNNFSIETKVENPTEPLYNALSELNKQITEGINIIKEKLAFYIEQVKTLLGDVGGTDAAVIDIQFKVLKYIRMINFIKALISAIQKGQLSCSSTGKNPTESEIDNFFNNFLNPQSSFNLWIDDKGDIHIDEKIKGFEDVTNPITTGETLPQFGNVLKFEGEGLIDYNNTPQQKEYNKKSYNEQLKTLHQLSMKISQPVSKVISCNLKTTADDIEKLNKWMQQLDNM